MSIDITVPMSGEIIQNLKEIVETLSGSIGTRSYAELDKLDRASGYIEEQFRKGGCNPVRQSYTVDGRTYRNIYSEIKGTGEPDEILVVGAHYDTVVGTPGADDNASGIAGMLELSRLTAENPVRHTVYYAAFTLEEPPYFRSKHMGSFVFAESLYKRNRNVKGMISLEMIGYFSDKKSSQYYPLPVFRWFYPTTGNYIAFVGNLHSKSFTNRFVKIFREVSTVPCESLSTISLVPGVDFSDHLSFWRFDYPAFMITDTAFYRNPDYHSPGDTAEKLNYEKMSELVSGLYETLKKL